MAKKVTIEKQYLVFISYSTKDRWIAQRIASEIEDKGRKFGIKTFLDEKDIEGGESIPESIRRNIQDCSEFLVLFSRYSINRPWVLIELGAAWGLSKYIVAIVDKVTPKEMPDTLYLQKTLDLNDFDKYLDQLCKRAKEEGK